MHNTEHNDELNIAMYITNFRNTDAVNENTDEGGETQEINDSMRANNSGVLNSDKPANNI